MRRNILPAQWRGVCCVAVIASLHGIAARAAPSAAQEPGDCRTLAALTEREAGLPPGLLFAIGQVETGRRDAATGRREPWPWSTNMAGAGHFFATAAAAIDWTAAQQDGGERSIDVGCFQINLKYHPTAFATLEEAFDPVSNARYAASFLSALYRRSGSWRLATEQYHSGDPLLGRPYGDQVFALLSDPDQIARPASFAIVKASAAGGATHATALFGVQIIVPQWALASAAGATGATGAAQSTSVSRIMLPAIRVAASSSVFLSQPAMRRLPVIISLP